MTDVKLNLASLDPQQLFDQAASFYEKGMLAEAEQIYLRLIATQPSAAAPHHMLGTLRLRQGRGEEALALFDSALAIKPGFAETWNNRGNVLSNLGRHQDALASYEKALAIRPDYPEAWNNLGNLLLEMDRIDDAIAAFMRLAELTYGAGMKPPARGSHQHAHRLRHDQEQFDYRAAIAGQNLREAGARLSGAAVTPQIAASAREWRTKKPQITVIDNLLTPEALEGLRRFCLEQPVWRSSHKNGYLGAFLEHGFACPLLGQIAQELRDAFPEIFGSYPLCQMWAFKYDSKLSGIDVHADNAAVNVNFWLTPDEANLDPESGGLVVWDAASPQDWPFDKMNNDTVAIREFLARSGAKPVNVPYRSNRAVIFNSDLFHETGTIRFKDGYLNRRVNVTMLFGKREQRCDVQTAT